MSQDIKRFIINGLRRMSYKWKPRNEVKKKARIRRGIYLCAGCGGEFPNKEVCLDHVVPVVDPEKGFESWDVYIERMFPEEEGFQVLCSTCHDEKTAKENSTRKSKKRAKKKLTKKKKRVTIKACSKSKKQLKK